MMRGMVIVGVLFLTVHSVPAQPGESSPAFEVASIKVSKEPEGSSTWNSSEAGSLRMRNQTLRDLIRIAYEVKDNQISGGPKWLNADRYHVDAKAAAPARDLPLRIMLQNLLAERFHLVLHRETKLFPGYALVVGKNGLKIKSVESGPKSRLNSHNGHVTAEGVSLEKLAQMLSGPAGALVTDETNVAGVFNFTLDWSPEADNSAAPAGDLAGASLFTALQEQLGLKLEPRKISLELLVIDSAQKATEN